MSVVPWGLVLAIFSWLMIELGVVDFETVVLVFLSVTAIGTLAVAGEVAKGGDG